MTGFDSLWFQERMVQVWKDTDGWLEDRTAHPS